MTSIISVENLSKWYGQVIGVNDVSFELGEGVVGLLGPNGAGKTTLIRLLTGQLKPKLGKIRILNQSIWNNPSLNRIIGYCPEFDAFYDRLTGYQFLEYLLRLSGFNVSQASEKALAALETVSLIDQKDRKVGAYSKGMRQRLKLAQSIAHDPQIIFLDEPLNGMDPLGRRMCIKLIRKFGLENKFVMVSSHILHEVESMTENIVLMNHGKILASGKIFEIRELIRSHPLQFHIISPEIHKLASRLISHGDILSIKFDRSRDGLTIETDRPDEFCLRLAETVVKDHVEIRRLVSPDEDLQAVFEYLVR